MIGVVAKAEDHAAVAEFFELFKTPWAFFHDGLTCEVLICAGEEIPPSGASLVINYEAAGSGAEEPEWLDHNSEQIPVYCGLRSTEVSTERTESGQTVVRIGYNLFAEVKHLLSKGQPQKCAAIPTLDLHIDLLRRLILEHEIALNEIPPVPHGYSFIACLTHDVDHPRVRHHGADKTMFGLLFRALVWWPVEFVRGRQTLRDAAAGWRAALALPFVHLGWARDFWDTFERYVAAEGDARSTFFVLPKKGKPGLDPNGRVRPQRAASYQAADIAESLRDLQAAGREIGVHGIDAWRDSEAGREELERIRELTGMQEVGVRMHWLYSDDATPIRLERAGYSYDSTSGYNDAIGYRAGTMQAFRPLGCEYLMELPMNVMDTALFYQSYMNLSPAAARREVDRLIDQAVRLGGVLTINWHDRSLAPERMWGRFYTDLLSELRRRGAWLTSAGEAVAWFRARREAQMDGGMAPCTAPGLPALQIFRHEGAVRHAPRSGSREFSGSASGPATHSYRG